MELALSSYIKKQRKYNNPGFMSKEPEYQLEEFPVGQRGDFKINNNNDGMGSNTSNI